MPQELIKQFNGIVCNGSDILMYAITKKKSLCTTTLGVTVERNDIAAVINKKISSSRYIFKHDE